MSGLARRTRTALVSAWVDWDAAPGNPACAERFLRARQAASDELGTLPNPHLLDVLMAWHRSGLSRERCVIAVEAGIEATTTEGN